MRLAPLLLVVLLLAGCTDRPYSIGSVDREAHLRGAWDRPAAERALKAENFVVGDNSTWYVVATRGTWRAQWMPGNSGPNSTSTLDLTVMLEGASFGDIAAAQSTLNERHAALQPALDATVRALANRTGWPIASDLTWTDGVAVQ